jgi:N-acetylglucosamine-6-phosphate deacetylase
MLLIHNAQIMCGAAPPVPTQILIDGSRIEAIGSPETVPAPFGAEEVDVGGRTVLPGFVESHVHGAGGDSFGDADAEGVRRICRARAEHGTTCLVASVWGAGEEQLLATTRVIAQVRREEPVGARLAGIHLEGPYLNPQYAGAVRPETIREPGLDELSRLWEASEHSLRVVTLAPEVPGALHAIHWLREQGVTVAIGHSGANFEETRKAVAWGARVATHIFNSSPPLHHRHLNVTSALLTDGRVTAEVICDGLHLAPCMVRVVQQVKRTSNTAIITNASFVSGLPDGVYERDGYLTVLARGEARQGGPEGTLAGTTLTMEVALRNMMEYADVTLSQASVMASATPAQIIGELGRTGRISTGRDADLVILDDDGTVWATLVGGRFVYAREQSLVSGR